MSRASQAGAGQGTNHSATPACCGPPSMLVASSSSRPWQLEFVPLVPSIEHSLVADKGGRLLLLLNLPALGNMRRDSGYVNDICLSRRLTMGGSCVGKMGF